ncbi:fibronectin type III domain-containing protein [Actinomadura hibisca]|uniref:fibronectin type III domain-containing protein n=1 Tax=Actinomadura hibisca TaxID=68565 RepID=UPI000832F50C|nr:fibronectin type III domain-containing protein [Actinomadura hibisca]
MKAHWKTAGKTGTALAVAAGALCAPAGAPAAADPAALTLTYTCDYPLIEKQPLTVKIKTDVPKTIKAGEPSPALHIEVLSTVGPETTSGLALIGAETLEGTATSHNTVDLPDGPRDVEVPVTLGKVKVPVEGGFDIPGQGDAPRLVFPRPGTGKISVGRLALHIVARDNNGVQITDPDVSNVPCVLNPGQDATLATFQIVDGGGDPGEQDTEPPTAPGTPAVTAATATSLSLSWPAATDDRGVAEYDVYQGTSKVLTVAGTSGTVTGLTPDTAYTFTVRARDAAGNASPASPPGAGRTGKADTVPPGEATPPECGKLTGPAKTTPACVYMAGYSNLAKLGAATALNDPAYAEPAPTNIVIYPPVSGKFGADFQFVRPMRGAATTLQFRFMPVTAKMELTQVDGPGRMDGTLVPGGGYTIKATARMSVRLHDVRVNGTPLEVGPRCRTVRPAELVLTGGTPEYKSILLGGPLRGVYTVPPFTGCGVGEDLSPLLTAAVSGPGNAVKMMQGKICMPQQPTCPRQKPER